MGWGCPHLCVIYMSEVSVSAVGDENHSSASVSISPVRPQGFPGGAVVKNLPATQETRVQSLGREDPLEKEMATHSSILAWRIPWTEEPRRLQSMGLQRVEHD